ncbi:unnamed protein product [Diamesa serratosioi]
MKNLSLLYLIKSEFSDERPKLMTQNSVENETYFWDGKHLKSISHNNESDKIKVLGEFEDVIAMEYVQINNCLCLATVSGEIIAYNLDTSDHEIVSMCSDGIETMCWSPDQELVIFVTKANNVIIMFSTFDVLLETSLHDKSFGDQEFMTVGWGKKETQFHGSVGKDARKKDDVEIKNVEELDKTISAVWRGDGEYFAVNFVGINGRMFKVFNKEGVLQFTSEICAQLEVPIAWRPSGLWIAKPEVLPDKYIIRLFEKNGLKHYELVLPFSHDKEKVRNMTWNQDSDILLIETYKKDEAKHCIYLYTINNYHWYLKQYLEFDCEIMYNWSLNFVEPKKLLLFTSLGSFSAYNFDFSTNRSTGASLDDESIVAVIDGDKLLLTNFRTQLVPPPMCSFEVPIDKYINQVKFLESDTNGNNFLTIDYNNTVKIYKCNFEKSTNGRLLVGVEAITEFSLQLVSGEPVYFSNPTWLSSNVLVLVNESEVVLCRIDKMGIIAHLTLDSNIGSLVKYSNNSVIVQTINGLLHEISIVEESYLKITDKELQQLPEFCEKLVVTTADAKPAVYALKNIKKKLYLNSKELATEVTSFTITTDNDFLIYTTIGEIKFLLVEGSNKTQVVETRRVERGSKIVSLVKDKAQIILQLPRGNLETITPRILSLKIVKNHLRDQKYKLAFDLLRKERINLNLLIDVNPQKFLSELRMFVEQIDNIQWLNLFLTELKNEDVTKTMYKYCVTETETSPTDESFKVEDKINYLCGEMLGIFIELDATKYLLPAITCHVKNDQVEQALQRIWDLKKTGSADKESDDALKYLLYLIDVNVLYNIALGMYDYQLVLFVAQKSQKDPKEYVPFLNELNKLDQNYAKYKIDCHLKRFDKAIENISQLSDDEVKFEECVELVKKHSLYEAALQWFQSNPKCYKKMCFLYGDYLRIKGKLMDASLMYERGGEYQQAMMSARNILDWQRCLVLAKKSGSSQEDIKDLAGKLIVSLKDTGKYKEAAELVKKFYPEDVEQLLDTLAKGKLYSDALFEVEMSGKCELIEGILLPQLKEHLEETMKIIDEDHQKFSQQKLRLLAVRQEKTRKLLEQPGDEDDMDMFSDTTSMASSSINSNSSKNSNRTFKSSHSKTRRKHERKLLNLKEGNKFEDIALIDSLSKLIQKIFALEHQNLVKDLIKNSIELNADDDGRLLQKSFRELLLLVKGSLNEIWIPEMMSSDKFPETEEDMNQAQNTIEKSDFNLISKFHRFFNLFFEVLLKSFLLTEPEQRFKPKLTVIEFEYELYRENKKVPALN